MGSESHLRRGTAQDAVLTAQDAVLAAQLAAQDAVLAQPKDRVRGGERLQLNTLVFLRFLEPL